MTEKGNKDTFARGPEALLFMQVRQAAFCLANLLRIEFLVSFHQIDNLGKYMK
jgi:hypothetical protein